MPEKTLSRRERQMMDILYRRGRATASEIHAELPDRPSYSAVRAKLRVLEEGPRAPRRAGAAIRVPAHGAARPGAAISSAPSAGNVFRQFQRAGHRRPSELERRRPGSRQIGPPFRAHRKGQKRGYLKMPSIGFLLDAAAKATVILAAAWLLTLAMRVMHRGSAAARYFTWTCALGAVLAVPALSPLLPGWNLRVKAPAMPAMSRTAVTDAVIADAAPATASESSGPSEPARTPRTTAWPVMIWLAGAIMALMRIGVGHLRLALSLRRAREGRGPEWIAARDVRGVAGDVGGVGHRAARHCPTARIDACAAQRSTALVDGASRGGTVLVSSVGVAGGRALPPRTGALVRRRGGASGSGAVRIRGAPGRPGAVRGACGRLRRGPGHGGNFGLGAACARIARRTPQPQRVELAPLLDGSGGGSGGGSSIGCVARASVPAGRFALGIHLRCERRRGAGRADPAEEQHRPPGGGARERRGRIQVLRSARGIVYLGSPGAGFCRVPESDCAARRPDQHHIGHRTGHGSGGSGG